MALLVFSIIITVISAIALTGMCALWVYNDAKGKTENAAIWALLSAMSFPVGLLIYLLVGRPKNCDAPVFKNNFKVPAILFAVLLVVSVGLLVGSALSDNMAGFASVRTGVFRRSMDWYSNGNWRFNAERANGRITRNPVLSAEELNTVFVMNSNSDGTVRLEVTQGNVERSFDLTDNFNGYLDMSDFNPGRIRMRLVFDGAIGVNTSVQWR